MTLVYKPRLRQENCQFEPSPGCKAKSQEKENPRPLTLLCPSHFTKELCGVWAACQKRGLQVSPCAPSALSFLLPPQQSQNRPRPASLFPAQPPPRQPFSPHRQPFSPRKTFYINGGSGGSLSRLEELRVMEPGCCLGPQPSPLR